MSRVSISVAARRICEALVTSKVTGVTRLSGCRIALRAPAYTRFAPRLSASSTRARPMPRLEPVIKTVLFAIAILFLLSYFDLSFHHLLCRRWLVPARLVSGVERWE